MSIRLKKINDVKIRPLPEEKGAKSDNDIFPMKYPNVNLIAKKKSGKSTVILNILKHICKKDTLLFIWSPNITRDPIYKYIAENSEKCIPAKEIKGPIVEYVKFSCDNPIRPPDKVQTPPKKRFCSFMHTSFEEDNSFNNFLALLQSETEFNFVLVLDDMSRDLKDKRLDSLYKMNRHKRCTILTSTQYVQDLAKSSRQQCDVWILFKGFPKEKCELIHKEADLSMDFDTFYELYKYATMEPFSCFFLNARDESDMRIGLSDRIVLE